MVSISCSLARNAPLRSFVGPLRSFAVFSHTALLVSFPVLRSYTQLCNGPRTRIVLGWHCTLYVVIGIITQTLRVIGMSQANIDKLERVQNILARVVVGAPRRTSSSLNIRRDLHWLPVGHRITYKLCLTTWKTFHTSQPLYLSELISHYLPCRSLCSSSTNFLTRSGLFCVCTFYLELSTCTHSFYRYPIDLLTPPKIPSLPVCLYRLVIQCLRFVLTIFGTM